MGSMTMEMLASTALLALSAWGPFKLLVLQAPFQD